MSKKTATKKKRKAVRRVPSQEVPGTAFALPVPSAAQHERAVKAMEPYLKAFQKAADDQVREDFGIVPEASAKVTPAKVLRAVTKRRNKPVNSDKIKG